MLELDETGSFLFSYVLKMWDLIKVILQHYGVDEETLKMTKETLENVQLLHLGIKWKIKQGLRKQFFYQFLRIA